MSHSIFPTPDNPDLFKVLDDWIARQPDALLYTFLDHNGEVLEQYTYRQFAQRVDTLAAAFRQQFEGEQDKQTEKTKQTKAFVLLAYQPGLEMIAALFACNKAGLIGVPTPPLNRTDFKAWWHRFSHIAEDSGARYLALCAETERQLLACSEDCETTSAYLPSPLTGVRAGDGGLKRIDLPPTSSKTPNSPSYPPPPATFFIQYTSGSTSQPKGVMVSHRNLIANCAAVVDHPHPIAVSWLPQHHDMGLIGYYIDIMLSGGCTYGFAPAAFMRRPLLWFETISRYQATASSVPNFALELCLHERRVPEAALAQLDLSSLRFLMVAAEPVKPQTFAAFLHKFGRCGLSKQSLFVAYGLAEFTLAVSSYGRRALTLDAKALEDGNALPAQATTDRTIELMSCGKALSGSSIRIVDPHSGRALPAGQVGEIWLAGQSAAQCYYNKPELTARTFHNTLPVGDSEQTEEQLYLRTGDNGFIHAGELFICGRRKEMLIINGRNIYPQDIETLLQEHCPQVRRNAVVAFQASSDDSLIIAAELVRKTQPPDTHELLVLLRTMLQIPLAKLIFLAPKAIPKTSSGKLRRNKTRELYERAALTIIADSSQQPAMAELDYLRARYQLSGEEEHTLFDAGVDSLDLIVLLHWLKDQIPTQYAPLATRIDSRLFGIISIRQLFTFADGLQQAPQIAIAQATQWLDQALCTRREEERQRMLADRGYVLPPRYSGPFTPLAPAPGSTREGAKSGAVLASLPFGSAQGAAWGQSGQRAEPFGCAQAPRNRNLACKTKSHTLLTGATGFLGIFLLAELLTATPAHIYVLVRGKDSADATARLRNTFFNTLGKQAPMGAYNDRVTVLCGDLDQPRFGLAQDIYRALAHKIDTIYHNGALVNYLLDYARMRASNVTGTRRMLDFALTVTPKVFNYISTTFIFGWATKAVLAERDNNAAMELLDFGYAQSKWVAEQRVLAAMQQGAQARIFRPALITPALNGGGNSLDITLRLLAFMLKYGVAVNTQNQVSFMPVDTTATNIVAIAQQADSTGQTLHVTRDQHETLPQITQLISQKTGIQFTYYDLHAFVPEVVKRCTPDDPLYPLLDFLTGSVANIAAMEYKQYSNANYQQARDQSPTGQQDAPLEQVVDGILSFLQQQNLLPCHTT